MAELAPSQRISTDADQREVHFAIGGFWTRAAMEDFLRELARSAVPFMKTRTPFSVLGDLSDFVPQDRATTDAIRTSLLEAKNNGMRRFAMVTSSALVRMQYRRVTRDIDAAFFDDAASAQLWLRSAP